MFVDCDDVLHATGIESARMQLQHCEIAGCAMEIVRNTTSLRPNFWAAASVAIPESLATVNVFGMSNTAYRTDVLRGISPSPPHCRLMDWFMATAGWIRGARFSFDNTPRMMYRQYGHNIAPILPPFTPETFA